MYLSLNMVKNIIFSNSSDEFSTVEPAPTIYFTGRFFENYSFLGLSSVKIDIYLSLFIYQSLLNWVLN